MRTTHDEPQGDRRLTADTRATLAIAGLAIGLFFVDVATPLGYADWILHLAPVAAATLVRRPQAPVYFAILASVFALTGYALSAIPPSMVGTGDTGRALANRGLGIVTYWIIGLTGRAYISQRRRLEVEHAAALAAREELRQRALELTATNRFKSEFLANVSHELRTPLNSALIMTRLLIENRAGKLTAEQMKYVETIESAAKDLVVLIDDILDLSKVEAGRIDLRAAPTAPAGLLDAMGRMFAPVAASRGLSFACDADADTPSSIVTDSARVSQVLKNLLSNAFKFTERGGVTLRVAARAHADGRRGVAFVVADSGIGIAPEQRETIFEQFRQADGSISRRFGGTGLGLAISRRLAGLLGGTLDVTSREGVGSSFTLWLPETPPATPSGPHPQAKAAPSPVAESPAGARDDAVPDRELAGRRILVVDDDVRNVFALTSMLEARGAEVVIARNGLEAVQTVGRDRDIDLVLMDVMMPEMDGLQATREIRRRPEMAHLPIVALTAKSSPDDHERTRDAGANDHLTKPIDVERLVAILRAQLLAPCAPAHEPTPAATGRGE